MDSLTQNEKVDDIPSILVKIVGGYQKVYLHEIEYIEAQNKEVDFVLDNGKIVTSHNTISYYDELFASNDNFYRCHRSFLVYLPNIDFLNSTQVHTKTGKVIPIARGVHKEFHKHYQNVINKTVAN